MSGSEVGRRFAHELFAALRSPAAADRGELLSAASAFLDAAQGGDPEGVAMARRMALAALDFAVWPDQFPKFRRAADAFRISREINEMTSG